MKNSYLEVGNLTEQQKFLTFETHAISFVCTCCFSHYHLNGWYIVFQFYVFAFVRLSHHQHQFPITLEIRHSVSPHLGTAPNEHPLVV